MQVAPTRPMQTNDKKLVLAAISPWLFAVTACGDGPPPAADPEATRSAPQALDVPAPRNVFIGDVEGIGDGCGGPGSMIPVIAPDRRSFTLVLREMQIAYPPSPPVHSKTCKVFLRIHAPPAWQYGVKTIESRGYMNLAANVEASQTSSYTLGGRSLGAEARRSFVGPTGPLGGRFTFTDYVSAAPVVWSPCGVTRPFTIESRITVDASAAGRDANAIVGKDFEKVIGWEWRRC